MSRTRYRFSDEYVPHFLTCTIVGWQSVFIRPKAVEIVFDSWRYFQTKEDWLFFGYVVMENHLHFVASAAELANGVKRFKSFTARKIIDFLEEAGHRSLLQQLEYFKARHKTQSDYQLWQEGSHPKALTCPEMLEQKLEYMHYNPVRRGYVDRARDWRYSSARCFEGEEGLLDVVMG